MSYDVPFLLFYKNHAMICPIILHLAYHALSIRRHSSYLCWRYFWQSWHAFIALACP
ncbi:hypothetical protein [Moraxella lacunata]|uniref:hypothetical protein n=1 Tax=Moraxella lacunata TaxID=477 RepID=UPI003EE30745